MKNVTAAALFPTPLSLEEAAALSPQTVLLAVQGWLHTEQQLTAFQQQMTAFQAQIDALKHQLDWFKRQTFGQKSEKRIPEAPTQQLTLAEALGIATPVPPAEAPTRRIPAHTRKSTCSKAEDRAEAVPFFDADQVPVTTIEVPNPEIAGLTPEQYTVIGTKETYRLAQQPGSYVVIKYVRPVIKRLDTQVIHCPASPVGVLEGSRADVSFAAGMVVDKFLYHLPLYRIHQRLQDGGFTLSRPWLTRLIQQIVGLLEPIYDAQLASIRTSRVKAMDETPIKAGLKGPGKMKQGYFWPVYGEQDEICFPYCESRRAEHVDQLLGLTAPPGSILLTDGYAAYSRYAQKTEGLTHAQCWAHTRREFYESQDADPQRAAVALDLIGQIYAVEAEIREQGLKGVQKHALRLTKAKPLVEVFFTWVVDTAADTGLLPSNPLSKALAYAHKRRAGLEVFLSDPEVPMDTNHLERGLRVIPMGRKNWLFCWTELGAKQVGIVQSLLTTCRLHDINPYDYLVDVLQRVGQHPASRVAELTPRLWKQHFAANPLRSDLYNILK
ncbi:IS66 family transposase [Acidithiobacillus sp.]|uniref:IS66 family transposase n=1 Tax=Acidithiobacillus sp. TaxID=1872118 RepID=UPI00263921D7|nr:IS66 family transposase [Acidithiobacillus sp.]MDD5278044.1 IS66 family transposase [Acidithiobacillus sp.]